jgi:hypothetical protein
MATLERAIIIAATAYRKGIESGLLPSPASLTLQAIALRKSSFYASHPVEAALRYHSAQAETPGEAGDDSFDFESAESLYRAGAQGLRLSEIPQLPQNLRELSRLGALDRAARTRLRRWVESNGPIF